MNESLYMQRAIDLASFGLGHVSPNPLVGCVIVHNEKIIGEGYHHCFGGPHAEIVAINSVKDRSLLKHSTMYVTLEPCSHYGKTPPCSDTIIQLQVPKVVVSCVDPNPLVAGKGIQKMIEAGIKVETGLLKEEYRFINRRFFTFFEKKRPYIILKWAQSKDGFIDYERNCNTSEIHWISNSFNKMLVHKWRSEEMGILVGANTVINDNPQLTNRLWIGNNPTRIIFNHDETLPQNAKIFDKEAPTIIYSTKRMDATNAELFHISNEADFIEEAIKNLYERKIISILVEGGRKTLQSFIDKNLWDEARVITGNNLFYKGIKAPSFSKSAHYEHHIDKDFVQHFFNH